jgi:NADH-quinone oxidoreductase subunit E/NADP-reducing hydrogenase subunit HndA
MSQTIAEKTLEGLPKEGFETLDAYIATLDDREGSLIAVLHKAQQIFGYLPSEVQLHIARALGIPGAKVFGVVSFYSYFTTEPVGKHTISVCMGTACFVRGAEEIFKQFKTELGVAAGGTTEDGLFTLKDVRCIGACGLAPVVVVGEKVYGRLEVDDVTRIIEELKEGEA